MTRKALLDARSFSDGLDQVSRVLKKSSIPILSEVLVSIHDGQCTLTATDLNTWLVRSLPATGDDLSFVFQNTKNVAKACRFFDGPLELELTEEGEGNNRQLSLLMRCGSRVCEFAATLPNGYPERGTFDVKSSYAIEADALLKRVSRVGYATRKESSSSRTSLNSVQMKGNHVFALDGRRLACDTDPSSTIPDPFMTYADSLSYLKLFGTNEVMVELGERQGRFTDQTIAVEFRITGIDFFNLEDSIPKNIKEEFYVAPKAFLQELKYFKQFTAKERTPYVRFCAGDMFMPVKSGKYRTCVDIDGTSEITFAFDLGLMMDAIQQFKAEPKVKLKVSGAVSPIVIEAEGRNDFALVCPTKLTDRLMAA